MQFTTVTFENFRCFARLELPVDESVSVVIAPNGVGKTSIIDGTGVGLAAVVRGFGGSPDLALGDWDLRRLWSSDGTREPQGQPDRVVVSVQAIAAGRLLHWEHRRHTGDKAARIETPGGLIAASTALPLIVRYSSGRFARKGACPDPEEANRVVSESAATPEAWHRIDGYAGALQAGVEWERLRVLWADVTIRAGLGSERALATVNCMTGALRRALGSDEPAYDADQADMVVNIPEAGARPVSMLSDGWRCLVGLVADIALRCAKLNPQMDDASQECDGIVLVDEIDQHLHPALQATVVERLRAAFPRLQFVLSTHSPQVISSVQPRSLVLVRSTDEGTHIGTSAQAFGLDANTVLDYIMDSRPRNRSARVAIEAVEQALESGELETARSSLLALRELIHGDDPTVARLEATINNLEALADAEDPEVD